MSQRLGLDRPGRVRAIAIVALVFATLLATQGAIVRATGSGLGCPDWPLCHNAPTPPPGDTKALIEYLHRLIAGIGGIAMLIAAWGAMALGRRGSAVWWTGLAIVPLLGVQVLLGATAVLAELPAGVVTLHLATASLLIGALTGIAIFASAPAARPLPTAPRLLWISVGTAAGALGLIAMGGFTSSSFAGGVCPEWPLCDGELLPLGEGRELQTIHMLHRLIAAAVAYATVHLTVALWRERLRYPLAWRFAVAAVVATAAAVTVGALNAVMGVPEVVTAIHSFLAQSVWIAVAGTALALQIHGGRDLRAAEPSEARPARSSRRALQRAIDFIGVTKPRVVLELLVTTVAAMVVAARGLPPGSVVASTIVGGALAAGAAASFNSVFDRDLDRLMHRTRRRPLAANRLSPIAVSIWGTALLAAAMPILWVGTNWVAAALTASAFVIYVGVYTLGLKRRSTSNIVIGGAAGAIPPVVGWVAGAGGLDAAALVLFAIVFIWTPPHFWALSLLRKEEYARAGIPMLPVVRGDAATRRQIFGYSLMLVLATLILAPINQMGWVYAASAAVLGIIFVQRAWLLLRAGTMPAARSLYRFSITYLTVLFAAMVVDALLLPAT